MFEAVEKVRAVTDEIRKFFVGYDEIVNLFVVALISEGHILLEGPSGVGKTLLAKAFALSIGGSFSRIQMTPDLLPADIIGTVYYDLKEGVWRLRKGPIHANIVLVDELNRATPRTQSALLEAMQERQVTIEGKTIPLPRPFLVVATRIPFAGEGSYQLPLGEIDRFSYSAVLDYPDPRIEMEILGRVDVIDEFAVNKAVGLNDVVMAAQEVRKVFVSGRVKDYIVRLIDKVRRSEEVSYGPSPRASIWLLKGARVLAYLDRRDYVIPDDVKALARNVLRHRINIRPEYAVDGITPEAVINEALDTVEVPKT